MRVTSAIAVYFIIWWTILFAVLPWGNRTAEEAGEALEPGQESSAPVKPRLFKKFIATTVLASLLFAGFYWLVTRSGLTLDDVPFLPKFSV